METAKKTARAFGGVACRAALAAAVLTLVVGCGGGGVRKFPLKDPLWVDQDKRPFAEEPDEYFSPFYWDGANQMLFRPLARFFAVDPAGESVNVNALDEVADSAWFTNRIGRKPMTPAELAEGACTGHAPIDPAGPWTVTGAKPNGANPGFLIKAQDGRRYLLKFDGVIQGARPTSADVMGSKIYYAAGYTTPCNRVIFFDRSILKISPDAESENEDGDKVPMTDKDLDVIFEKAMRLPDGRYRGSASLFLDGKPIGPFTYEGTRSDDPNDIIPHEDRRDLRGMYVLAAWTNHFDSREQNTLDTWHEVEGKGGYIRHNMIDFGDCFGSIWEPPMMGRRIGHSYYLDIPDVFADLFSFGIGSRPWQPSKARFGKSGAVFGYYGIERFVPDQYKPGYPNPAFSRVSERDAAWMTRILAEFTDDHVRAFIREAKLHDDFLEKELLRVVLGRRDKIYQRYLTNLSPLSHPEVGTGPEGPELCMRDLAVYSKVTPQGARSYTARGWMTDSLKPIPKGPARPSGDHRVCINLPAVPGASESSPEYLIVQLDAKSRGAPPPKPVRVHLYHLGGSTFRVVGLHRPYRDVPPG